MSAVTGYVVLRKLRIRTRGGARDLARTFAAQVIETLEETTRSFIKLWLAGCGTTCKV